MATGENSGTWGNVTNTNIGTLIEQAVSGVQAISMSDADRTLTALDGATDEARNAVIIMTGSLSATRNVIVPPVDKVYIVRNLTTGGQSIVVKTSSGSGVTVANAATAIVYCDATNVFAASAQIDTATNTIVVNVTGNLTGNVTGNVTGNLTGNVTGNASGTAANVTGTVAIANGGTGATTAAAARTALGATATGSALFTATDPAAARTTLGAAATGAIGSSGVTMNTARLLGRTTASSGAVEEISVGSGLTLSGGTLSGTTQAQLQEQLFTSSGTWTAPAGVTRAQVLVIGGGGGGGGANTGIPIDGGAGGFGGVAVGNVAVTPGTAYTVTVGVGGAAGGNNANGNAGTASSFGVLMSATGGAAGLTSGASGASGTGTGGTTRNGNVGFGSSGFSPFDGAITRANATASTAAVVWSISSNLSPGCRGAGGQQDGAGGSSNNATGGASGIVYIQWVA